MKTISLSLVAAALMSPVVLLAQETGKEKEKRKDLDQIIITRKGDTDKKVVIEVDGDKILVDGKEYKKGDGDVTISRNRYKDAIALSGGGVNSWNTQAFGHYNNVFTDLASTNRAMLGVTTEKTEDGVKILEVTKESPAEKIGLTKGDIILKIDDRKIETSDDLSKAVQAKDPGDKVKVTYKRDKKESTVTAELAKWKGVNIFSASPGVEGFRMNLGDVNFDRFVPRAQNPSSRIRVSGIGGWNGTNPRLGLSVQDTEDGKGVKVLEVEDDSNGAKAGIKTDDVITEVDGKAVNSTDEIARIMRESKEKISVKMKVQRGSKTETLDVKIPRRLKTADL